MNLKTEAIKWMLKNEDDRWDTSAKLEYLNDGAGATLIGITERDDEKYLPNGMTIEGLYGFYQTDRQKAIDIIVDVYSRKYWNPLYESIADKKLAIRLFDFGVNAGIATAVKILQMAAYARGARIVIDGQFGNKTLAAINRIPDLLPLYKQGIEKHYRGIAKKTKFKRFLNGWLNRLNRPEPTVTQ